MGHISPSMQRYIKVLELDVAHLIFTSFCLNCLDIWRKTTTFAHANLSPYSGVGEGF